MKIENAALKESLENMEHLTSSVRRLRVALFKVIIAYIFLGVQESSNFFFSYWSNIFVNSILLFGTKIHSCSEGLKGEGREELVIL